VDINKYSFLVLAAQNDKKMNNRTMRRVYLVTYSKADFGIFPERSDFGKAVAEAFNSGMSKVKTYHYAVCKEKHQDGSYHYHCAIKLTGPKRWLGAKHHLNENHGVVVHFSDNHDSYYSAYQYICKEDANVFHSEDHPNLMEAPATEHCIKATRNKKKRKSADAAANKENSAPPKPKKLTPYQVSKYLVEHEIKDRTSLLADAKTQEKEGKLDLINFCLNYQNLDVLIENTWELEAAPSKTRKEEIPRMDVIRNNALKECSSNCDGLWLQLAEEVLLQNNVKVQEFAKAMRDLLEFGRGKHRNILIVGPSECAKTFVMKPLKDLFKTFSNPGEDKYSLMNAVHAEIIFLNDFRWSSQIITWRDFLLLLEGEPVHLPTPRNHFRYDVCLEADTPIVATSISTFTFKEAYNGRNSVEDEMMAARWKLFKFSKQIPESEQRDCDPCPQCFARLVLS
jgi:hypothetical protein